MTSPEQRTLEYNCILKDIKGTLCCVFKVCQYNVFSKRSVLVPPRNTLTFKS